MSQKFFDGVHKELRSSGSAPGILDVVVCDYTLDLVEVEAFSKRYGPNTGGDVRITSRWGGPAAGGPGWGGPEIAVAIIVGEMLRRASSDAYALVRDFTKSIYSKIRTRDGARLYIDGAMAIGIDSETKALRILFCFPEGFKCGGARRSATPCRGALGQSARKVRA